MRLIKVNGLKRRKTISVVLLMMYAGGESEPQTVQVLDTCVFFPIPALLFSRRSVCSHHLFVYSDLLSVFSSFFFFFLSPRYSERRHYDMQIHGQLSSPANNSRDPEFFSLFFFFVVVALSARITDDREL